MAKLPAHDRRLPLVRASRAVRARLSGLLVVTMAATALPLVPALAAPTPPAPSNAPAPLPPPADASSELAVAEKLYADLDYERANMVAARVSASKGLTHAELVRALRLLALTDAAMGYTEQAREEFIELLTYAPDFQVDPNLGPRVTGPFLEARGFWRARPEKPGIEITPAVHADGPGTLRVVVRDPTHIVKAASVGFRWGSSVPYDVKPLAVTGSGDGAIFDVPERPANLPRLDYYAQAFDDHGNAVMEVGNPLSPKSVVVDLPKAAVAPSSESRRSIFASPLFWTVAGVVVAGAATTTYLLTRPKSATGATLTGAAECGSGASVATCH